MNTPATTQSTQLLKGDVSVTDDSVDPTEISDGSLDLISPAGTPLAKMFSCCLPKAAARGNDDEDFEDHGYQEQDKVQSNVDIQDSSENQDPQEAHGTQSDVVACESNTAAVPVLTEEAVVEKTREIQLEEDPAEAQATAFSTIGKGVFSVAVMGAVGAVVVNGLAQAV